MTRYRISGVGPEGHTTSDCVTPVLALARAAAWTGKGYEFVKISDHTGRLHAPADFERLFGINQKPESDPDLTGVGAKITMLPRKINT
ncbi:MAG: hypothetical protein JWR08_1825 [Enterovirga sp.]|jgi:hypothetical protein|nr:hypothetical protein [Enterovirga sp.]